MLCDPLHIFLTGAVEISVSHSPSVPLKCPWTLFQQQQTQVFANEIAAVQHFAVFQLGNENLSPFTIFWIYINLNDVSWQGGFSSFFKWGWWCQTKESKSLSFTKFTEKQGTYIMQTFLGCICDLDFCCLHSAASFWNFCTWGWQSLVVCLLNICSTRGETKRRGCEWAAGVGPEVAVFA